MRHLGPTGAAAVATLVIILLSSTIMVTPFGKVHAAPNVITQVSSGLVSSDSLATGSTAQWTFGGDAASQPGAKFSYAEDAQGLHISVQPGSSGTWAGYYAVSPGSSATLYHATVTLPYSTVPDNGFNTGVYVQTANNDFIDYIGCLAVAVPQGNYWAVVQSYGVIVGSQMISTLYQSPLDTLPLTQDCTIITNGNNYVKVYIGGSVVVDRNNMTLNMPPPEQAYLEPQSSTATSMLTGTYKDYYATTGEDVQVTNAPVGETAEVVAPSNVVLASAQVASDGIATIPVGKYTMPIGASVEVLDSSHNILATTAAPVTLWGGDVYTVSSATTTSSSASTSSSTTAASSSSSSLGTGITVSAHRIPASYWDDCFATSCTNPYASCDTKCTGPGASMYFDLYDAGGNLVQSAFADEHGFTFAGLTPGATYYLYPDDCDMCHTSIHDVVFEHWGDGSNTRPMAVQVGANMSAWYSCTNECLDGP